MYKGLGAVLSGIIPKMAIRFAAFETYKNALADQQTGKTSTGMVFIGMTIDIWVFSRSIAERLYPQLVSVRVSLKQLRS